MTCRCFVLQAELRVAREQTRHQGVVLSQLENKVTAQAASINKSKSTEIASEQAAQQGFEENLSLQVLSDITQFCCNCNCLEIVEYRLQKELCSSDSCI